MPAGRGPPGFRRADHRIAEDAREALTVHPAIDAGEIEIAVRDGIVLFEGTVENRGVRRLADAIAESATGVRDVDTKLRTRHR
ncbi:MAG TPA: BON domain-containing protein [Gemmatimonadales bacterium]|nr:BON domain-containing protein [Gemmatimonadales bacterium]